ncbi:MAG: hypothetical protein ABA06_04095 [Parcubacteria bacterium C7867-001]|nr:MAG: hypothetical protein ABA06_04095 [Parcubacteria bacterium C7867-001]
MKGIATAATALSFGAGMVVAALKVPEALMLVAPVGALALIFVAILEFK